jgi:acryloyl-coenzyme A reductase
MLVAQANSQTKNTKLQLQHISIPEPHPNQVLVKVLASAVCYRDILDKHGLGVPYLRLPMTPGHEFAGIITKIGKNATHEWKVGDAVANVHGSRCGKCDMCISGNEPMCKRLKSLYGITHHGGYAEYVLCDVHSLVKIPEGVSFKAASMLMCTAGVALRALKHHGQVKPGQTVLVTGASGGVGVHALQIAKILGAKTIALTTSESKVEKLKKYADKVVCCKKDFHKVVSQVVY